MSQNIQVRRGDSASFTVTVTQSGSAYNLTGATMRFTVKWAYTDADNVAVFSRTSPSTGITFTSAVGGIATITFTPANTSSLPANIGGISLFYDIQVTDGSGNVFTVLDGTLTVLPDVSITTP